MDGNDIRDGQAWYEARNLSHTEHGVACHNTNSSASTKWRLFLLNAVEEYFPTMTSEHEVTIYSQSLSTGKLKKLPAK